MANLAQMEAAPEVDALTYYRAWKQRREENCVTRMRFAGLRFVVYCRRKPNFNPRRTMGYDECRI